MTLSTDLIDLGVGGLLLFFTGAESAINADTTIELIAKIGVIAVLWYWLQDMKKQMNLQKKSSDIKIEKLTTAFDKETDEIRNNYKQIIEDIRGDHTEYRNRIDKFLIEKDSEVNKLHTRLYEYLKKNDDK